MSPLHDACVARDLTGVQVALRAGYKVDAPNDAGITPLMCAAVVNCAETVKELLEFGASVRHASAARLHTFA
jgi:ankyrin repeat protein